MLKEYHKKVPKNSTYMSKTTQNDLIKIIGDHITEKIVKNIKDGSRWFAVQADETLDIANHEQLTMSIRYVDKNCKQMFPLTVFKLMLCFQLC